MFDIDLKALAALQRIFGDGVENPPATVSVTTANSRIGTTPGASATWPTRCPTSPGRG